MSWKKVGDAVGQFAPMVGTLLAGPAGGAVGKMISAALGTTNSPEAVLDAIKLDPGKLVELKQFELKNKTALIGLHLAAETKQLQEVNATMRAEYAAEGWYKTGWRPFIGWVMGLVFGAIALALVWVLVKDPTQLMQVAEVLVWLIGAGAAILGVNIRERTKGKQAALGQPAGVSLVGSLLDRVRR